MSMGKPDPNTKSTMRTMIIEAIVALALCCAFTCTVLAQSLDGFVEVAVSDDLRLLFNEETTEIAVQSLRTGRLWFSNPQDRSRREMIARGTALEKLGAQIYIGYYTSQGEQRYMNSVSDSLNYDQVEVVPIDGGVRVVYTLGKQWEDDDYLPVFIAEDEFKTEILEKLASSSDRRLFENNYRAVLLKPLAEGDVPIDSIYGVEDLDSILRGYTVAGDASQSVKKESLTLLFDQLVSNNKELNARADITSSHLDPFRDTLTYVLSNKVRVWDKNDMIQLLKDIGYSPEQRNAEHRAYGVSEAIPNALRFTVAVEYVVDGDALVVRIPAADLMYPQNVLDRNGQMITVPLNTIGVLEFFGAAGTDAEGYMLVPDGSGALIGLNNQKTYAQPYKAPVYGTDLALMPVERQPAITEQVCLPVYGLKSGDQAIFAIIEEGDALASICADVAGRQYSYNRVYPEFTVMAKGVTSIEGGAVSIPIYQPRLPESDLVIRYYFLEGEKADYSGMAMTYRAYLMDKYGLKPISAGDPVPFVVEIVGGVKIRRLLLGIPVHRVVSLTSFDQAQIILDSLRQAGIEDIKVRYTGWLAGGIRHNYPTSSKAEPALGGERAYQRLIGYAKSHGVTVYPDVSFLNIYDNRLFSGFLPRVHASRFLNRAVAYVDTFDIATGLPDAELRYYLLAPQRLPGLVEKFESDYRQYGNNSLFLGDLGRRVYSNNRDNLQSYMDRQQALHVITGQVRMLYEAGYDLAVEGGNAPILPYVTIVVDVPSTSSRWSITDRDVPFLQIAVSGLIDYTGEPLNMSGATIHDILKNIEVGALPYFLWTYENPSVLKNTPFDYLYSTRYTDWIDEAVDIYREYQSVFGPLRGEHIIKHEEISDGVCQVTYSNGVRIIVNYTKQPVEIDGLLVAPSSYAVTAAW